MDKGRVISIGTNVDISDFKGKMNEMDTKMQEFANNFSSEFEGISNKFDKLSSKIKRFTFSLVGVHSIYRLLSKASNAYLSQDLETSYKLRAAWTGLGAMFSGLLKHIGNFTIKAVKYFNVFVKALTGVDYLAKAMDKSFRKAAKGVNTLKGALAGIDEITNIDIATGGATDVPEFNWAEEFNKVDLDPKLVKFFENLGNMVKKIDFKTIIEEVGRIILLVGKLWLAWQFVKMLGFIDQIGSGLKKMFSMSFGDFLTKLQTFGGSLLVIAGLVTTLKGIISFIKDPSWSAFAHILIGIGITLSGISLLMGNWRGIVGGLVTILGGLTIKMSSQDKSGIKLKDTIKDIISNKERLKELENELSSAMDDYTRAVDRQSKAKKELNKLDMESRKKAEELYIAVQDNHEIYSTLTDTEKELYHKHKDLVDANEEVERNSKKVTEVTEEQIEVNKDLEKKKQDLITQGKNSVKALKLEEKEYGLYKEAVIEAYEEGSLSAEEAADLISKALGNMDDKSKEVMVKGLPKDIADALTPNKYDKKAKKFKDWWNGFIGSLKTGIDVSINAVSTGISSTVKGIKSLLGFADGLQEVPHDMVAVVHKGEAIVPARFNKDQYFQGASANVVDNREVVHKLDILIDTLRDKDMSVNIDKNTIGEMSTDYIRSQNRILGRSVI